MTTRRLAAILAADVVGFSSLMERDEEGTLTLLKATQRDLIEPRVREHHGRIVKTTGDGFLIEFGSPLDAVRCALEVQEAVSANGAPGGSEEALRFRMGINLGDIIIQDDGDIYGDGVNVATRLEQIAQQGSVFISGKVFDEIEGKLPTKFAFTGEQHVKNLTRPVRVYSSLSAPEPKLKPKPLSIPQKPSIAVLPFTNMSGDPSDEFFADGVAEDIITALSHFRGLFVIARNSSFTYKADVVDVKQVGKELGVRYVLEGSVRRGGNRIRVTGQLIEAETGRHLWAEKFEGAAEEVFDFQDRISEQVVGAIQPSLWHAEAERLRPRPTESLTAYELYLRAVPLLDRISREGCSEANALLERAIKADPQFGLAYALLAQCHFQHIFQGWSSDIEVNKREISRMTRLALEVGSEDAEVLYRVAFALTVTSETLDQCLFMFQRALELNPNSAHAWQWYGWCQVYAGQYAEAISCLERARRLNPRDLRAGVATTGLCACEFFRERFEAAIKLSREALAQNPRFTNAWRYLIASLAHAGLQAEAEEAARELKAIDPNSSVRSVQSGILKNPRIELLLSGLRKAGLSEVSE
jgi:adenylate cyclase